MYDVIVVGARCAGAPLAMLLARAGHRVALVDRTSFPSDTMSTHFLWQRGTARLQSWGLLGRLRARGCAPIRQITFDPGPVQISGIGPAVAGAADTYCPRRTVLDALLVEAAVESGADLIERFVVGEVIWSDGRAAGVRGRHPGSARSSLRAAVVVGADGAHSGIARRVGARAYREHPPLTAVYYSYWSGIRRLGASFHARPGQLVLVWPTNDDLTCIYVAWPRQDFHQVRRDIEDRFHAALELIPGLREAAASGHREARFTGTADLPSFYRESAGPGWALAGDAGHHKDPCTGMGISDAFLAADLLADAIHQGLSGNQPMDQTLACYQRRRDALTANGFELTLSTARLAPLSPRLEALYRTAADQPEIARHVFGVLGGSIPLTDLHTQVRLLLASLTAPRRPARCPSPRPFQPAKELDVLEHVPPRESSRGPARVFDKHRGEVRDRWTCGMRPVQAPVLCMYFCTSILRPGGITETRAHVPGDTLSIRRGHYRRGGLSETGDARRSAHNPEVAGSNPAPATKFAGQGLSRWERALAYQGM